MPSSIVWLFRPHMYSRPDTETARTLRMMMMMMRMMMMMMMMMVVVVVVVVVVMMEVVVVVMLEGAHALLYRVAVPAPHVQPGH